MRMAVKVTKIELIGPLIDYQVRTLDSPMPGVGNWVEPFIDVDNAGRGAGFGVIRNRLVLFDVSE